jgi:uncharacterized protein YukE
MARIKVEPGNLQGLARFYWSKSSEIDNIQRTLDRSLSVSGWVGSSRWSVENEWCDEKRRLERLSERSEELAGFLNRKASDFTNADQQSVKQIISISRNVPRSHSLINPEKLKNNIDTTIRWMGLGCASVKQVDDLSPALVPIALVGLDKLQDIALHRLRFTPASPITRDLNIVGPGLYRRIAGISPNKSPMHYNQITQQFKHTQNVRHAKLVKTATYVGYGITAGINIYTNWRDHREQGATRVATGAVVDTALDIALSEAGGAVGSTVGSLVGATIGTAIGGPVGTAIGYSVGGIAGNIAGRFVGGIISQQIKKSDAYQAGIDQLAKGVETTGRGIGNFVSGAWYTIQKEAKQVNMTTGLRAITTYVQA